MQWFRPVTLQQLLALRDQFPLNTEQGAPQYHIAAGSLSLGRYEGGGRERGRGEENGEGGREGGGAREGGREGGNEGEGGRE